MSALAMILTTAMVAPGDGPEKMSGEMTHPGLDFLSRWEGTLHYSRGEIPVGLIDGKVCYIRRGRISVQTDRLIDEGRGRFRVKVGTHDYLGIYRYEGNRLLINHQKASEGYPVSFKILNSNQGLLVLHRIKSRK